MIQVRGYFVIMGRDMGQAPRRAPSRGSCPGEAAGEPVDGVLLHRRGDVAVDVHRRGDRGVPEAFLHDLGRHAEFHEDRRVRVPQALERDAGQVLEPLDLDGPLEARCV